MQKGDIITLGTYPQGEDKAAREPIRWQVLETKDGTALLLSLMALDYRMYHGEFRSTSWKSCDLRAWLNGPFLQESFTDEEKQRLQETPTGRDLTDRVFLLSRDDLELLTDLRAAPTEYADLYGSYIRTPYTRWWLRTQGNTPLLATVVGDDGVNLFGLGVALKSVAVRPAITINIE